MSKPIITALAKVLPTLENAKKNAANPHFKSKYANLSAVMAAVEPIAEHGLWYRQQPHDKPDGACIETIYMHESGEEMSAGLTFVKADKQNPQGFGSAMTYARRYSLQAAFGLDAEDDDGHAASQPRQKPVTTETALSDDQLEQIILEMEARNINPGDLVKVANENLGTNISQVSQLPARAFNDALGWVKSQGER